jgi:hypothetical protein
VITRTGDLALCSGFGLCGCNLNDMGLEDTCKVNCTWVGKESLGLEMAKGSTEALKVCARLQNELHVSAISSTCVSASLATLLFSCHSFHERSHNS